MECRLPHRGPDALNRLQHRNWRERAGSSNLYTDIQKFRRCLPGPKFECNCPTRRFRSATKTSLKVNRVDFNHNTVDLVIQLIAPFFPISAKVDYFIERMAELTMRVYLQPKIDHPFQIFRLGTSRWMDPVAIEVQRTLRGNGRIELTQ